MIFSSTVYIHLLRSTLLPLRYTYFVWYVNSRGLNGDGEGTQESLRDKKKTI